MDVVSETVLWVVRISMKAIRIGEPPSSKVGNWILHFHTISFRFGLNSYFIVLSTSATAFFNDVRHLGEKMDVKEIVEIEISGNSNCDFLLFLIFPTISSNPYRRRGRGEGGCIDDAVWLRRHLLTQLCKIFASFPNAYNSVTTIELEDWIFFRVQNSFSFWMFL